MRPPRTPVLVSAHRVNSVDGLEAALRLGVDYVEFDVRVGPDGELLVAHDAVLPPGEPVLPLDAVLARIRGRARAHIDLKFTSDGGQHEVAVVRRAVEVLGADHLVVTPLDGDSVRAIRDWADAAGVSVLVGFAVGRSVRHLPRAQQVGVRILELIPRLRYRNSRANVVVAKHTLARLGVAWFARRQGLPLLVWTVDTEDSLRYWLQPGRCWLVTTNHPDLALRLRGSTS